MKGAPRRILLTGGTGRLGCELRALLPSIAAPSRAELDVTRAETIEAALKRYEPDVLVHAAAYTDVAAAEKDREACWRVNVEGTRAVVRAASDVGLFLVHISTDYVFEGTRGMYKEEEPPGPVRNYYALSKLVAEEVARLVPRHLIIRTSFRPREWPYPVAFTDVYTSQDYVDVIAPEITRAIQCYDKIPYSTLHIVTERKTVYELARRRRPDVQPGCKRDANVALPDDSSLDASRWQGWKAGWGGAGMP